MAQMHHFTHPQTAHNIYLTIQDGLVQAVTPGISLVDTTLLRRLRRILIKQNATVVAEILDQRGWQFVDAWEEDQPSLFGSGWGGSDL